MDFVHVSLQKTNKNGPHLVRHLTAFIANVVIILRARDNYIIYGFAYFDWIRKFAALNIFCVPFMMREKCACA